ncbi:hypothetical protein N7495_001163 [Penicillium taxi]|uniref:uncharacterized protein n=1 Tax=Penicillium taxi TaxID=168475 RepID=UPI002544FBEC|nr:uncharacterized protein N7495_001163 [Penicillium taxi]KAJ5908481.1 hypothetical protein N7495_001163 [Penicillium taxi]
MMDRPANFSAKRMRQPDISEPDDSVYESIRLWPYPEKGWTMETSAGVLLKDHLGHEYMSVASHGFPVWPFSA